MEKLPRCCLCGQLLRAQEASRSGYRTECLDLIARVRDSGGYDNESSSSRRALVLAVTTQVSRCSNLLTAALVFWLGEFGCTSGYKSVAGILKCTRFQGFALKPSVQHESH